MRYSKQTDLLGRDFILDENTGRQIVKPEHLLTTDLFGNLTAANRAAARKLTRIQNQNETL